MSRKKRTPEENERREKIRELLKISNVGSMEDIQKLFCSISIVRVGLFFTPNYGTILENIMASG